MNKYSACTKPKKRYGWLLALTSIYQRQKSYGKYSVNVRAENWIKRVGEL